MEETAAYAIIAELDSANVSLFMGLTEISTGLVSPRRPAQRVGLGGTGAGFGG
jgi:hypothetical protein